MTEDCTNCKNGKPMLGITFCKLKNKPIYPNPVKCENYEKVE